MSSTWKFVFCFLILFNLSCSHASYIAAVVEYSSADEQTPASTIEKNVVNYINLIQSAKNQKAQIIIFPEYGLTDIVQNPENYSIELPPVYTSDFSNTHDALIRLSYAALEQHMYVVVNLLEKEYDASNKSLYYNTNIVFANNGTYIARYRKINLFQEPKLTPGNEIVTFKTDFGEFGLFIGADILNYHPSQTLLKITGVTNVVYTTAWHSNLPFYMSLGVQAGYALSNKVNLLAANINDPSKGQGGSGIYLSDGTVLRRILTDKAASSITVGPVDVVKNDFILSGFDVYPEVPHQELSNYKSLRDFDDNAYTFKPLDLKNEAVSQTVCHGSFCCSFKIDILKNETNTSEIYRVFAYNGKTIYDSKIVYIQLCNLIACSSQDTSSCGERPAAPYTTIFRRISVTSNFTTSNNKTFFRPVSLRGNLISVYNVTYSENVNGTRHSLSYSTTKASDNVVLFGLYGRGGGNIVHISMVFVAIIVFVQAWF